MDLPLFLTLAFGFGAQFVVLLSMKDDIHRNNLEFAKCPLHTCKGEKND